jgi:hypothetical protein
MLITRKQRRLSFILLVTGISLFLFSLPRRNPAVSLEAEERIQFGMAEEEVLMSGQMLANWAVGRAWDRLVRV